MRFRYTFKQKSFMSEKMSFLSPFLSFYSLVFPCIHLFCLKIEIHFKWWEKQACYQGKLQNLCLLEHLLINIIMHLLAIWLVVPDKFSWCHFICDIWRAQPELNLWKRPNPQIIPEPICTLSSLCIYPFKYFDKVCEG